ncbi:hypothetical protein HYV89_01620 [Candidatus Woesearchaeota archaeon]|nr:hypothetical protein [Candidatus Woesearchaeota archaeon]
MKRIFQRPYIFWFIFVFTIYMIFNIVFSGFYDTIPLIIIYAQTVNWVKLSISIFLSLITGFLVSLLSVLLFIKYKEREECKKAGILAGSGALSGLAVGICPLCVTGIFPIILASLGVSFSFASLPFQGTEIQFLIVFMLLTSFFIVKKSWRKV